MRELTSSDQGPHLGTERRIQSSRRSQPAQKRTAASAARTIRRAPAMKKAFSTVTPRHSMGVERRCRATSRCAPPRRLAALTGRATVLEGLLRSSSCSK